MAQLAQCARPRCAKAPSRRTGHGRRPCLAKGARAQADEATVACQKGGMYPTFDSAAGSGEIPVFFGILPYLILRVTRFDSAAGPIPVNIEHCVQPRTYRIPPCPRHTRHERRGSRARGPRREEGRYGRATATYLTVASHGPCVCSLGPCWQTRRR